MKLDIKNFLDSNGIYYRSQGTGVKKGNVVIKCPYCGDADKGQHLGISLKTGQWGCWRDDRHRGNDLAKLLSKLTGSSYAQLKKLITNNERVIEKALFDDVLDGTFFSSAHIKKSSKIKTLLIPKEFRRIRLHNNSIAENRFLAYLKYDRGFNRPKSIFNDYGLFYALTGEFKNRIIFPITLYGQLVTWTSRTIQKNATLRYKSLSDENSSVNIKDLLYNFDTAFTSGGDTLFIVEGPMDVLKFDTYAKGNNAAAVGLFNMSISDDQLFWIEQLSKRFDKLVLLLDSGETGNILQAMDKISSMGINIYEGALPAGVKDPGELDKGQVVNLCSEWRDGYEKKEIECPSTG